MKKRPILLLSFVMLAAGFGFGIASCDDPEGATRVATFNVENYPKHDLQRKNVPEAIGKLNTPIVALQEVVDPKRFEQDVQKELGNHWVLAVSSQGPSQKLAVLYDSTKATLVSKRDYSEPILHPSGRPAFETRFEVDGEVVRVMNLHLKAGGKFYALRAAQWWALLPLIERGVESEEQFLVLGDFNATGWADRVTLFGLSLWTGTKWLSRGVECSHYWSRDDECVTTTLDHALTTHAGSAKAHGACETVGCDQTDRCPTWVHEVSDHCPVVFDFE